MKKLNKCDLKKLALLGIASGTILSGEAGASDLNNYSEMLAFNGCSGGGGGCGNRGGNSGNYQAYRSVPSQSQAQYYQPSSGCQSAYAPQYYQPSSSSQSTYAPQYYQPSGCQSAHAPQYYQPSSGCQSSYASQGQFNPISQPSHGCGAAPQTRMSMPAPNQAYTQWETGYVADTSKHSMQRSMSESELLSQLNDQGKATYNGLDASGKALSLKLANQECKGHNECKGLNSCKAEDHSCAGRGSCAGTAKSNFQDKNLAVKVAAMKMAEKRSNAASSK